MSSTPISDIRDRLQAYRLFVVPYCHADWAWTHSRHWHELRYVRVIEEVLDILEAEDESGLPADEASAFRWYMDVYVTEAAPFLSARPGRYHELRQRIAEGRVAVCGAFANVRINHAEGETFLRSLIYGRRTFRELFPEADLSVHSDAVDVAVGHPQLPQIFSLNGYQCYQFWRPHEALDAKGIPHHFVWEGLDGSRVLCSRGCYSGLVARGYAPPDFPSRWPEVVEFWWQNVLEAKVKHSPVNLLWLQHGADDSLPLRTSCHTDQPLDLAGVVREWNRREASSMKFATPVEVCRELEALRDELPVVSGTLDPCDVSHKAALAGANSLWSLRRQCGQAIPVAETLDALTVALGVNAQPAAELQSGSEELWRNTLTFSCHAAQWTFEEDFAELDSLAQGTIGSTKRRQRQALASLVGGIAYPPNALAVVFNALPFERTVTMPLRGSFVEADTGGAPAPLRFVDGRGEEVPLQVQDRIDRAGVEWELDTLVQLTLPPGGWNVVGWERQPPASIPGGAAEPDRIASDRLELHFKSGRLMQIADRATGVEWQAPAETPFGHLRAYDVDTSGQLYMGPITGQQDARWQSCRVVEAGPVRWALRAEGCVGPHRCALETRLYRGERRVEFHARIDCVGMGGFVASHLPLPGPGRLHGDMPFCVEAKDLAREPYVGIERQRPGMFIAQSFVDWTDGERSMAYVSHDGDRYYGFDATANTLWHVLVNAFRQRTTRWENHINRRADCVGTHEFTYSLIPHEGDWREARLWQVAHSLREPPLLAWPAAGGELPAYHSFFSVQPANVTLSACYLEAGRIMVRVFENAGREALATIALPFEPLDAQLTNLLGEQMEGPAVETRGAEVLLRLRAWQIATVALTLPR